MKQDELDRVLSESREIRVSDDFTAAVMARVRHDAEAPAPLAFPWKRFLPGMGVAAALTLGALIRVFSTGIIVGPAPAWVEEMLAASQTFAMAWAGGALLASLAMYRFSMRLAGYRR